MKPDESSNISVADHRFKTTTVNVTQACFNRERRRRMFHVGQFQLPWAPVRPEEFRLPVSHTHTMPGYGFTFVRNLTRRSVELLMKLVLLPLSVDSKKLERRKHTDVLHTDKSTVARVGTKDLCCYNPYQMLRLKKEAGQRGWSGFEFLNRRSTSILISSDNNFF